jgi:NTP pyrophosphatase (non-canonical NTP hydrolase)
MNLTDYDNFTKTTACYPVESRFAYLFLGLASEAGELAGKYKKILRDNQGVITPEHVKAIKKELGDVGWYMSRLAGELGLTFEEVLDGNVEKLTSRKERGVIGGDGDDR